MEKLLNSAITEWGFSHLKFQNDLLNTSESSVNFIGLSLSSKKAFSDGVNANRQAMDYKKSFQTVRSDAKISVKLCKNGGYAAVITEM